MTCDRPACQDRLALHLGAPWKNGYAESILSQLQDEFPICDELSAIREASFRHEPGGLFTAGRMAYESANPFFVVINELAGFAKLRILSACESNDSNTA